MTEAREQQRKETSMSVSAAEKPQCSIPEWKKRTVRTGYVQLLGAYGFSNEPVSSTTRTRSFA